MTLAAEARPSVASPRDEAMGKVLAAIRRAPKGPPLTPEEQARIGENHAAGYPGTPEGDFMAALDALGRGAAGA